MPEAAVAPWPSSAGRAAAARAGATETVSRKDRATTGETRAIQAIPANLGPGDPAAQGRIRRGTRLTGTSSRPVRRVPAPPGPHGGRPGLTPRPARRQRLTDEGLEVVEGATDEEGLLLSLIAGVAVERRQEPKGDVGRLVVSRVGAGDVPRKSPEGRRRREDQGWLGFRQARRVDAGDEAGGGRLEIPLDTGDLAGKEQVPPATGLEGRQEDGRRVDVRVAVHLAEARKFRALEAGDHPEHPDLLGELEMILEADHRVKAGRQVVLPELHDGERLFACARVDEADRLHRAECERLTTTAGHLLDRQAPLEVEDLLLELVRRRLGRPQEGLVEAGVLGLGWRAVEVILAPLAVARCPEHLRQVDRVGIHDGRDRADEAEVFAASYAGGRGRYRLAGQGASGKDARPLVRDRPGFIAQDAHLRERLNRLGDAAGETLAVDRQSPAGAHPARVGHTDDERVATAHLLLQETGRRVKEVRLQ